jgi:hypothetical protein
MVDDVMLDGTRNPCLCCNPNKTAILPAMLPSRSVAAIFASRGGQVTSRTKRKSSLANGRKGGRPRKRSFTEVV